jgi:hypothetical protein
MAWERRERGGFYYTRSKRVNGRVEREYVGGGIFGELAAYVDAQKREQRALEAKATEEEHRKMEDLDARVSEFYEGVENIASAVLLASGYRKHKRGEWRRKREFREMVRRDRGREDEQ